MEVKVRKDRYSPEKMGRIKSRLLQSKEQGKPDDYEIIVDHESIVKRTNDISLFDMYADAIDKDTESITVRVYYGQSPRNVKHILVMDGYKLDSEEGRGDSEFRGLSGLEMKRQIIEEAKREWEAEQLRKEFLELKKKNEELAATNSKLATELEESKGKEFSLTGLAETAATFLGSLAKTSPEIAEKIGGKTLAGIAKNLPGEQMERPEAVEPASSFKIKEEETIREEDRPFVTLVKEMREAFSEMEFTMVANILDMLSKDRTKIKSVHDYLVRVSEKVPVTQPKYPAQA